KVSVKHLHPILAREYAAYLADLVGDRVFTMHPGQARTRCRAWGKTLGIANCHPHRFRHSVGTRLLEKTGDLMIVRDVLDHAKVSTTQGYTKVAQRKVNEAIDQL